MSMGEPFFPARSYAAAEAHFNKQADFQQVFGSSHLGTSDADEVAKKWKKFKKIVLKSHKYVVSKSVNAEHQEGDGG